MISVGAVGYALLCGLYLLLTILLLTAWRGRRIGGYLIVACLVSGIWSGLLALQAGIAPIQPVVLFVVEVLRAGAWIAFLVRLLQEIGGSRAVRYGGHAVWLGVFAAGLLASIGFAGIGGQRGIASVFFPGGLAVALTGLVLIEQLYRNSPADTRWSLKWLVLGLGGLFAYDLFLYSQAVLFGAIDVTTWTARGYVNLLFVPLIAVAARRNPDWNLRIFVSRQVVFYSTTLTAVGLYLLLMSVGGYLLVRYGGSWGGLAQIVFLVGAGIVLFTLLFSSTLRARTKVFLSKHFFQNRYDYREEWLRLISTLSRFEDSSTRQVVIEAMAQIVDSPAGFLWMYDEDGRTYRLVAEHRSEDAVHDVAADDPVVSFIRRQGWIIDLAEYAREPDSYGDLDLPEWLTRLGPAWLIVPVMYGQRLLGFVLLYEAPGPPKLNYEDRDLLKTVGNHIAVHLAQEQSDRLLAEAKQFEAYNRLTAFLMHDLNNLIAQQSLIVENAEKHKRKPEFVDDAIDTIANSVKRMKKVMVQLKRGEADHTRKPTPLKFIVSAAVDRCSGERPVPSLTVNSDAEFATNVEEFTMVLSHLIRNAQQATPDTGHVTVDLDQADGHAFIKVTDDGAGMSPEFIRDRLFRPFDSTRGVEGMGIGAYQAREFARKLGGDIGVESAPGRGTTITMTLPL